MASILHRILYHNRYAARRHVQTTYQRLLTGDTTVIADIPESVRTQALDNAWNTVRNCAWDAVRATYAEAHTNAAAAAYDIEGTS